MSDLLYLHLPKPVDGEELLRQTLNMKEIRLLSLQTDSSNFISRYEDEVHQPIKFFLDRVEDPSAEHFVAVAESETSTPDAPTARQYHAFLVVLRLDPIESSKHRTFQPVKQPTEAEIDSSNTRKFYMAAVYVRPTYRGQGVCTRLIEESIRWASNEIRQADLKNAILSCTVAQSNLSTQRLYSKLGYSIVSHETEKNKAGVEIPVVRMELHMP